MLLQPAFVSNKTFLQPQESAHLCKNDYFEVLAHVSNPSSLEVETGGSRDLGHP